MTKRNIVYLALIGVLSLVTGSVSVWAQTAQQADDQSRTNPSTAAKSTKKKKADAGVSNSQAAPKKAAATDKSAAADNSATPPPAAPPAPPLQKRQPPTKRLRQTAPAWSGSTRIPAFTTSPARAGTGKPSRGST